jgi:hypothetical protein
MLRAHRYAVVRVRTERLHRDAEIEGHHSREREHDNVVKVSLDNGTKLSDSGSSANSIAVVGCVASGL